MTTFLGLGDAFDRRGVVTGGDSFNFSDSFWAAVHLDAIRPIDDAFDRNSIDYDSDDFCYDESAYSINDKHAVDIFHNSGCTPVIDISLFDYRGLQTTNKTCAVSSFPVILEDTRQGQLAYVMGSEPLPSVAATMQRKSAGHADPPNPKGALLPLQTALPNTLPQNAPRSPGSAILRMASNFLGNIVKLTQAHSTAPQTFDLMHEERGVHVMESEVFIDVIEGSKRTSRVDNFAMLQEGGSPPQLGMLPFGRLEIPAVSYDKPSSYAVDGLLGCSLELDMLSKMSWERQLIDLQQEAGH